MDIKVRTVADAVEEFACERVAGFIDNCLKDFGLESLSEMCFYFGIEVGLLAFESVENWKEIKRILQGRESILDALD